MVYFANPANFIGMCVILRDRLCPARRDHVSAQSLDSLDLDEISSFLNWKRHYVPIFKEVSAWMDTNYA
jgi:hypothetical protein